MTEQSRRQQIMHSLENHEQQKGVKETLVVPLARGKQVLPVITLPLSVPVLNVKSFRIAPELADHPLAELIRSDPTSQDAQRVVAELVRGSHKYADNLKESLKEGQDEPGVITRSGVLINANTRCVLMRELVAEGAVGVDGIRVAVLPSDINPAELLDLEAVIQKQRPHKDDYNLVSELMMLKRLNEDAGMSAEQIAKRQRLPGPKDVFMRLNVLSLMETARHLASPPLPLSTFAGKKSKLQNWKELLLRYQEIQVRQNGDAAERYLSEWLYAYVVGIDSVHRLRFATDGWVNRHVADLLPAQGEIGSQLVGAVAPTKASEPTDASDGLDLLDGGSPQTASEDGAISPKELLKLAVAARTAGTKGTVRLPDGSERTGSEVTSILKAVADKGLKQSQRQVEAGERLVAPENLLKATHTEFVAAIKAIDDVVALDEFGDRLETVRSLLSEIAAQVDEANDLLDSRDRTEVADVD